LLRAAIGIAATVQGSLYFSGAADRPFAAWALALILVMSGAALVIGFLTPLASILAGLCVAGAGTSWLPKAPGGFFDSWLTALEVITAVAIVLLGPGAFSVDGYLFGRREIVIPPRPPDV